MDEAEFDLTLARPSYDSHQTSESAASKRLRSSVAELVLETTAESIWLIDAQARTTFVNRRMARLLGYTEEEMIGRPIFDFLPQSRWETAKHNLQHRKHGREGREELELIRKDGTRVWVIGSANPIFDRDGQYAGALALLGDLTPQKERERLLKKQIIDLRARLAGRVGAGNAVRADRSAEEAGMREPFRTALVMAAYGTLLAVVAIGTAGGVISALAHRSETSPEDDSGV